MSTRASDHARCPHRIANSFRAIGGLGNSWGLWVSLATSSAITGLEDLSPQSHSAHRRHRHVCRADHRLQAALRIGDHPPSATPAGLDQRHRQSDGRLDRPPDHRGLGNGRLSDLDTELEQPVINARCTPERVLSTDAPNKASDIGRQGRATRRLPRLPAAPECRKCPKRHAFAADGCAGSSLHSEHL